MSVIDRINFLLTERGITGSDLSKALGFSSGTYSQWNTGITKPSKTSIKKVADYFGITVEELLSEDEKKPAPGDGDGLTEQDIRLLNWFRSLPPEKQKAILYDGGAPEGLV